MKRRSSLRAIVPVTTGMTQSARAALADPQEQHRHGHKEGGQHQGAAQPAKSNTAGPKKHLECFAKAQTMPRLEIQCRDNRPANKQGRRHRVGSVDTQGNGIGGLCHHTGWRQLSLSATFMSLTS